MSADPSFVFIHGMFMTPSCWQGWVDRFTTGGSTCVAPAWPGRDRSIAELRAAHPDPVLGKLSLEDVVASYDAVVRALPEPPVLIGHSMGGLVVQILLARGLGAAGIAIDSAPPKGVSALSWSFIRSNWPVITPFASKHQPVYLTFEQFRYAFVHTLSPEEQRATYDAHVVPESRLVGHGPLSKAGSVDFKAQRKPLLLIAGSEDHIIPAKLNRANLAAYAGSPSVTEFKEFEGRTHGLLAQAGWEEVADYALTWARAHR